MDHPVKKSVNNFESVWKTSLTALWYLGLRPSNHPPARLRFSISRSAPFCPSIVSKPCCSRGGSYPLVHARHCRKKRERIVVYEKYLMDSKSPAYPDLRSARFSIAPRRQWRRRWELFIRSTASITFTEGNEIDFLWETWNVLGRFLENLKLLQV